VTIAVAVKDKNNNVIGICKNSIGIERIFGSLLNFKPGKTAHVAIIDNNANIILHEGVVPMSRKDYDEKTIRRLLADKKPYHLINMPPDNEKALVIFSGVESSYLSSEGIEWIISLTQNASEALEPINKFIIEMVILAILLILFTLPVGYVFGSYISRPIHELHMATERVMEGDWDYKIDIRTGDEIEQFADTFKDMIADIKNKQLNLKEANEKLEEFSKGQEAKITERTKDLTDAQEATLNILEDLTSEKGRAEKYSKELEKALSIKSYFTSVVSHELRTPLTAIKEGISIVSDGTAGNVSKEQKDFLTIASRNVDRLARLINDVLDFQKLESGRMTFNMQESSINDIINDVGRMMMPLAAEKKLELIFDFKENLPKILFDRDKITQVVTNLVNNAIKFTDKGSITIITSRVNDFIQIAVNDTGPGIKQEDLPRLFRPFEQLESYSGRKTGGTGLGLSISKEIVKAHNGEIWAESELGKGSTIYFTLPVSKK